MRAYIFMYIYNIQLLGTLNVLSNHMSYTPTRYSDIDYMYNIKLNN